MSRPAVFLNGSLCLHADDYDGTGDYTWPAGDDYPTFDFKLKPNDTLIIMTATQQQLSARYDGTRWVDGLAMVVEKIHALGKIHDVRVYRTDAEPRAMIVYVDTDNGGEVESVEERVAELIAGAYCKPAVLVRGFGRAADAKEAAWRLDHKVGGLA